MVNGIKYGYGNKKDSIWFCHILKIIHSFQANKVFEGLRYGLKIARAKSSYGTCEEARRATSQEPIWNKL